MRLPLAEYMHAMGIETWVRKSSTPEPEHSADTLQSLAVTVAGCTACSLARTRTQTVFGVGNPAAELMLIGEAPGFYEDQQGEPFVGAAGKLLDAMLAAIGQSRQTVYIANILKCRPPNNRDPLTEEVAQCTPFLRKQIHLIRPKLILALGRIAAHHLLTTQASLSRLRGTVHLWENTIPLLVTWHPAYLLRNPADKRTAWEDLQQAQGILQDAAMKK